MTLVNPNMRLKETANGVIDEDTRRFYPYRTITGIPLVAFNSYYPKLGTRYYIKSVLVTIRTIAADTTTYVFANCSQNIYVSNILNISVVPSVAQAFTIYFDVQLLCDKDSAINCVAGTADPAYSRFYFKVAEIDDE